MRKAIVILSLIQLILIALILLSPIIWIYVGFIPFVKFLGASIVVFITTYFFDKGFERVLTKTELDNIKKFNRETTLRK